MPTPKDKVELLAAIQSEYKKLEKEISSFPLSKAREMSFDGHKKDSQMSFHNLLSYLLGWGNLVLKWNSKIRTNQTVDWPEKGYKWTELGELAQKFYSDYAALNLDSLKDSLRENHLKIVQVVSDSHEEELYMSEWYKHYPMGKMIQLNTSSPYKNARARIRKWKRENDI